jgi:hypothetical protein
MKIMQREPLEISAIERENT